MSIAKSAFKAVRGANHEANILAVANKQIDAASYASDTMDRITDRQPEVRQQCARMEIAADRFRSAGMA